MRGFLRFPWVPLSQKIRLVWAVSRSLPFPSLHVAGLMHADDDAQNCREWAERTVGTEAYTFFVRPAFEPFFFYEAQETCALFVRSLLRHSLRWRILCPRGGMGQFCQALARHLPVHYGCRVSRIERKGMDFVVTHGSGVEHARAVIVSIPPPAIRNLSLPMDELDSNLVREVRMEPSIRVNLGYERNSVLHPVAITPAGPGPHPVVGISAASGWLQDRAPPGKEIVRISASAWRTRQLLGRSPATVVRELMGDCSRMGIELPPPDWTDVLEEPSAIVRTPPGHFRSVRQFQARPRDRLYFAGDWLTGSTIEGAIRTGESAALRVARDLTEGNEKQRRSVPS